MKYPFEAKDPEDLQMLSKSYARPKLFMNLLNLAPSITLMRSWGVSGGTASMSGRTSSFRPW